MCHAPGLLAMRWKGGIALVHIGTIASLAAFESKLMKLHMAGGRRRSVYIGRVADHRMDPPHEMTPGRGLEGYGGRAGGGRGRARANTAHRARHAMDHGRQPAWACPCVCRLWRT
jgi:hypothetical protein